MRPMRRPGADVWVVQLTARALPAIRHTLDERGIEYEVHPDDGHFLLHSERGPRPLRWGDWLVFQEDGGWDVYGDVVIKSWNQREVA